MSLLNLVSCHRCWKETSTVIMSKFNTDVICMACKQKEIAHPQYKEASEAELAAVQRGDRNYPGIGLPPDL